MRLTGGTKSEFADLGQRPWLPQDLGLMDLFDFFFPEQAQATYLRRLADTQYRAARRSDLDQDAIDSLARENRELRLYLTAISELLVEKGLIRSDEIRRKVLSKLPPLPPSTEKQDEANPFAEMG